MSKEPLCLAFSSGIMPCLPAPGFSTLEQLKRRNTLKDGIIMIQTLLIIVFIIVPIFLLLDKVPTGAGGPQGGWEVGAGQTRQGQSLLRLCSFSLEQAPPPVHWLLLPLPHPDPHPLAYGGQEGRTLTL